ncbi:MAG: DNA repair protein RecN [Trueperaceae bacterium]|nr:DNA repair protein RecN [Trueperaceae bacterium]
MLQVLELQDFVLAEHVRLELGPGLQVLTGETGTGKSLLVDALALLAGGRADPELVRSGTDLARVQAEFAGPGLASASRTLVREGRNHARLDGELVTVAELADAVGARLAVFAQHAHQALLTPARQREALDRLLDEDGAAALRAYREAYAERRARAHELQRLQGEARARTERAETLRARIDEIDAAGLSAGEEEELAAEAARLRHVDHIAQAAAAALTALEEDEGAVARLARAVRELDGAARYDARLAPLARDLDDALRGAQAVSDELQDVLDPLREDPARLDEVEGRLARIQRLSAKYGEGTAAILAHRTALADELEALDRSEDRVQELADEVDALDARLAEHGARLSTARRAAADRLERGVAPLLARLALDAARVEVVLEEADPGPHGRERVWLSFAANRGEQAAPLAQAASGGELSRLMLALWLVTGSDRPTLVLDEVDAGVGGRAALAVGEMLAALAQRHQVLVVTHLAQVAAFADGHHRVDKETRAGRTVSTVAPLEGDARERELARMLAGHEEAPAVGTARDLLARAEATRQRG